MKFIFPSILVLLSIATFMMFTNPTYQDIKDLKADAVQYDEALTNSQKLQAQRDALSAKYRGISTESLSRLSKMIPDTADNIRLIINMQQIAQKYGMTITSTQFDAAKPTDGKSTTGQLSAASAVDLANANRDYGTLNLGFSTTGTYDNFLSFLHDIETSLRVTDIQTVDFSSDTTQKGMYTYNIKLKTYWLKS